MVIFGGFALATMGRPPGLSITLVVTSVIIFHAAVRFKRQGMRLSTIAASAVVIHTWRDGEMFKGRNGKMGKLGSAWGYSGRLEGDSGGQMTGSSICSTGICRRPELAVTF